MSQKLTEDDLLRLIQKEYYWIVPGTTMTVCAIVVRDNIVVTGESSTISMEDFNVEDGRKYSKISAVNKLWELEGYRNKSMLTAKE